MNNIEKEIKLEIFDLTKLIEMLEKKGAKKESGAFQQTTRMDTPDKDLEKRSIFLRVRSGEKNIVTLKEKLKDNNDVFERQEIETIVHDVDKMIAIFTHLGYTKQLIMEKYRLNYLYKQSKLAIDELPFGCFLEIEGEFDDIDEIVKDLELDISKKITVSYWDLFEAYKAENGIKADNIEYKKKHKSLLIDYIEK